MNEMTLTPGHVSLAQWQAIYRGAMATIDPGSSKEIERSAQTVAAIVARAAAVVVLPTPPGPHAMTISLAATRPSR